MRYALKPGAGDLTSLVEPLLAAFSLALAGVAFATWLFAFETRKTFRGGIFWGAWRLIASALPFFAAHQLVSGYEAVYGPAFAADAFSESLEAIGFLLLLLGFYFFYKAWNPRALASRD
jgi:hypothetical protein